MWLAQMPSKINSRHTQLIVRVARSTPTLHRVPCSITSAKMNSCSSRPWRSQAGRTHQRVPGNEISSLLMAILTLIASQRWRRSHHHGAGMFGECPFAPASVHDHQLQGSQRCGRHGHQVLAVQVDHALRRDLSKNEGPLSGSQLGINDMANTAVPPQRAPGPTSPPLLRPFYRLSGRTGNRTSGRTGSRPWRKPDLEESQC